MLLSMTYYCHLKVNAARHTLATALKVNAARHKLTTTVDVNVVKEFADVHSLVAFLSKPTEFEGFEQIIDFLNANPIKVDGKKVIISEATIKRDLKIEDEGGVDCLSNEIIFEQLTFMSSTMASAIICLATN
nr:hypothetical protein [Tanacetum cinerariifolium]